MANIKSAEKRARKAEARSRVNASVKSSFRTLVRQMNTALERDPAEAQRLFPLVTRALDQAASRGVIHPNAAARRKSRLAQKLQQRLAQPGS